MSRSLPISVLMLLLLLGTSFDQVRPASAQVFDSGDSGTRNLLPRAQEIQLARSAAPRAVSDSASVYVLTAEGYELAVEGSNGAACYVSRDWMVSIEPHCFDREGAATIMRIHMRKVELLDEGVSLEEAGDIVATELLEGELRLPSRPVMSWMMSSAQELVSPAGRAVGAWKPHVMIYSPYLSGEELALDFPPTSNSTTMLSGGDTPLSTLIVVVPDFVDPAPMVDGP